MQVKIGTVVSNKMQKTVIVEIQSKVKHPIFKKRITKTSRIKAHDDFGAKVGEKVKICQTRPISKEVHFKVLEVLK